MGIPAVGRGVRPVPFMTVLYLSLIWAGRARPARRDFRFSADSRGRLYNEVEFGMEAQYDKYACFCRHRLFRRGDGYRRVDRPAYRVAATGKFGKEIQA